MKTEQKSSIRQKKSTGLNFATFHGLNMLQSAVTRSDISAHGEANGAHQKTEADNVLNSQSSTRDGNKISEIKGKTVTTGKAVDKNRQRVKISLAIRSLARVSTCPQGNPVMFCKVWRNWKTFINRHYLLWMTWFQLWNLQWKLSLRIKCFVRGKETKWVIRTSQATRNPLLKKRGARLSNSWTFRTCFGDKLKQTKPGTHVHELEFPDYLSDASLCVVAIIKEDLERTKHLRKSITSLFVIYVKPTKQLVRVLYLVGSRTL